MASNNNNKKFKTKQRHNTVLWECGQEPPLLEQGTERWVYPQLQFPSGRCLYNVLKRGFKCSEARVSTCGSIMYFETCPSALAAMCHLFSSNRWRNTHILSYARLYLARNMRTHRHWSVHCTYCIGNGLLFCGGGGDDQLLQEKRERHRTMNCIYFTFCPQWIWIHLLKEKMTGKNPR